jgi:hypothetical protein
VDNTGHHIFALRFSSSYSNVANHMQLVRNEGSLLQNHQQPRHPSSNIQKSSQQQLQKTIPRIISKHGRQRVSHGINSRHALYLVFYRYFDVTWEGPVLDASGRPTSKVAGELNMFLLSAPLIAICHTTFYTTNIYILIISTTPIGMDDI